jgi:hypothetical protein
MATALLSFPGRAPAATRPLSAASQPHGIGIRLLQAPVSLQNDPRARVYIIDHLNPGTTIQRAIAVNNTTSSPQHVSLYAGGAQVVKDVFIPGPDNALVGWTTVRPSRVELQPGTSQTAEVTIAVPPTATAGESYAVVWAQVSTPGSGITEVNRVGVRIYLDVGPGGNPPTAFTLGPLSVARSSGGRLVISSSVDNTGQRAIDGSGTLTLKYVAGPLTAGPYRLDRNPTILPHNTGTISVTIPSQLPPGDWHASLTVTADTVTHTETGTIAIGRGVTAISPARSGGSLAPYLIGGAAALVVLAAAGGAAVYCRHHRRRPAAQTAKPKGTHHSSNPPAAT